MQGSSRSRRSLWAVGAICTALALAAGACGGDGGGGGGAQESYTLTLIAGKIDEFHITINCGAQAEAERLGVTVDFQGPDQFDAALQIPIVNAVIASKPDAILIAPTDTKALYAPIKRAADAGIKIVLVDTTLEQADLAVSQVASDNLGGGRTAATALAALIGGSGKVHVSNVNPGISTTDQRVQGFEEEAKRRGLDYLGQEYHQGRADRAAAITKAVIAEHPDLKGIFATNLFGAEGAAAGLREVGKQDVVKIVGYDAGSKQVKDLEEGLVQALIAQKPADMGVQGVQQAVAALDGEPTKPKIGTGSTIITRSNLAANRDAVYKSSC